MKKLLLLFLLSCLACLAKAGEINIYPMNAPTIDADPSDWGDCWISLSLQNAASTTNNMTGKFQLGYNMSCLYLIAEINDASIENDETAIPNTYERDCIEVFIAMDMDTAGIGTKYHDGVWQIRKQRIPEEGGIDGNNGKVGGGDNWNLNPLTSNTKFKALSSGFTNPYCIEMALPWDSLTYNLTPRWDTYGFWFDIAIADNTTGLEKGMTDKKYWNNNSDEQWFNTSTFGKVDMRVYLDESRLNEGSTKNAYSKTNCGEDIVNTKTNKELVSIYPNPITSKSTIEIIDGDFNCLVINNTYGRQIKAIQIQNQHSIVFSRDDMPSGLYFVRLLGKQKSSEVYKVVIN
jgi:hypothetical protein